MRLEVNEEGVGEGEEFRMIARVLVCVVVCGVQKRASLQRIESG